MSEVAEITWAGRTLKGPLTGQGKDWLTFILAYDDRWFVQNRWWAGDSACSIQRPVLQPQAHVHELTTFIGPRDSSDKVILKVRWSEKKENPMTNDEMVRALAQARTQLNAIRLLVAGLAEYAPIWADEPMAGIQRGRTREALIQAVDGLNALIRNLGGKV